MKRLLNDNLNDIMTQFTKKNEITNIQKQTCMHRVSAEILFHSMFVGVLSYVYAMF